MNKGFFLLVGILFFFSLSVKTARCAEIERVGDGRMPRVKVNSDGTIHVIASSGEGIYHYSGTTGSWNGGLISGTDNVSNNKCNQPFIGISLSEAIHLVYGPTPDMPKPDEMREPTHGLFYAINEGGTWGMPENIIDLYIEYEAIEFDSTGIPLIVALVVVEPAIDPAQRTNYGGAVWFRKEGETWNGPVMLREPEVKYPTLQRDLEGRVHLVMRWQYVHYSMFSGGSWHNLPDTGDTFDNILLLDTNYSMSAPSIFVDPSGVVHVVAAACHRISPDNWQWDHARYSFNDGGGWSEEHSNRKDGEMVMGGGVNLCSVGVDSAGLVHVFCVDGERNLLHSTGGPGSWSLPEVVDVGLSDTEDLPAFDTVNVNDTIHTFYAKPDGVYHLTLDKVVIQPEERFEETFEMTESPVYEEIAEQTSDFLNTEESCFPEYAEILDGDYAERGVTEFSGGCGCRMIEF